MKLSFLAGAALLAACLLVQPRESDATIVAPLDYSDPEGPTIDLAIAMGKTPVPANDRAGFVSNRVLMPMINEAFYAWMEGVAKPEDIDQIMLLGCNFPMGPLRLADLRGKVVLIDMWTFG